MKITRLFYVEDEVIYSFISSLLKGSNEKEIYFWFSELYYSGFKKKSIALIQQVYYDYYYYDNSSFVSYLEKQIKKSQNEKSIVPLLSIISNLMKMKKNCKAFQLTQCIKNSNSNVKKEMNKKIKNKIKIINNLIGYVKDDKFLNFCSLLCDYKDSIKTIETLLNKHYKIHYNKNISIFHKLSRVVAIMVAIADNKIVSKKRNFNYRATPQMVDFVFSIDKNSKNIEQRMFSIHKNIGCFLLSRMNEKFLKRFYIQWEYYAYQCPRWKRRMKNYMESVDTKKKKIVFKNDDAMEEFYEKFYIDMEDGPFEYIKKSMFLMEENTFENWIYTYFSRHEKIVDFSVLPVISLL